MTCLRLDDQLAFAVVQVSFAPVAEPVLADVGAVQPGEVRLNQVLLQLALEFFALIGGQRWVGEDSLYVG